MERTTAQLQTLKRAIMSAGIPDDDDDYEDPTPAGYGRRCSLQAEIPRTTGPTPPTIGAQYGAHEYLPSQPPWIE